MSIFRKKNFATAAEPGSNGGLAKTLTAADLILMGIGGIIGTGVFVLTGFVAADYAGPAVMLSYALAGISCILVALAYTELASMLPTSGGAYTYAYVALGEIFAWLVFAAILLEYTVATATVAAGWSAYIVGILQVAGINFPQALAASPSEGGIVNLPAMLIILALTAIIYKGNKESKMLNTTLVIIKILAIATFIIIGACYSNIDNWQNFMPHGFNGVLTGSSILFFAFTGFGIVATAAEECKNPVKDLSIGIIGSLLIAAILYVVVAGILTAMTPYTSLNTAQPLAYALSMHKNYYGSTIVAVGAICGMTTVIIVNLYGQSRVSLCLARDGLLPKALGQLHPKYGTPYISLFVFAGLAAILAGFFPYRLLGQIGSIGALVDYIIVLVSVIVLRVQLPNAKRYFSCPALFIIAPLALIILICLLVTQLMDAQHNLLLVGKIALSWFTLAAIAYLYKFYKRENSSITSS